MIGLGENLKEEDVPAKRMQTWEEDEPAEKKWLSFPVADLSGLLPSRLDALQQDEESRRREPEIKEKTQFQQARRRDAEDL